MSSLLRKRQEAQSKPIKTSQTYMQNQVAQKRVLEAKTNALLDFQHAQTQLNIAAKMEHNTRDKRRSNNFAKLAAEQILDEQIQNQTAHHEINKNVREQNLAIANEMEKRAVEKKRMEMEISRICNESEELKQLEQQLRVAAINKERAAQHEEKMLLSKIKREQDQAIDDFMEADRQKALEAEIAKEQEKKIKSIQLKDMLQTQIQERMEVLKEAEKEAEKDKIMIDNILNKIQKEEEEEATKHRLRREATKQLIKDYALQREQEVAEKKRREQLENEEIRRYYDDLAQREGNIAQKKAEIKAAADLRFKKIAEEQERKQREEDELRMLQELLMDEEAAEAREKADREKREREANAKAEMFMHNEQQMRNKREQRERELQEEKRLIDIMMRKFADDDRIEREKQQAIRDRKSVYRDQIASQKAEKQLMFENEKLEARKQEEEIKKKEEYRAKVIAEARKRILQQHATSLAGYLPKKTLRSEDELNMLKENSKTNEPQVDTYY